MKKFCLFILFIIVLLNSGCVRRIPQNKAGVVFDNRTGMLRNEILSEGIHEKEFLTQIYLFDLDEQKVHLEFDFLDIKGNSKQIKMDLRFALKKDSLVPICSRCRDNYVSWFIIPETRATVRKELGKRENFALSNDQIAETLYAILSSEETYKGWFDIKNPIVIQE